MSSGLSGEQVEMMKEGIAKLERRLLEAQKAVVAIGIEAAKAVVRVAHLREALEKIKPLSNSTLIDDTIEEAIAYLEEEVEEEQKKTVSLHEKFSVEVTDHGDSHEESRNDPPA